MTLTLVILGVLLGGVIGWLGRAQVERRWPEQFEEENEPLGAYHPARARDNFTRAESLRYTYVAEALGVLSAPACHVIKALAVTDGMLARHVKQTLTEEGCPADPDHVEDVKQELLDANLVRQDQENRIWLRDGIVWMIEGLL